MLLMVVVVRRCVLLIAVVVVRCWLLFVVRCVFWFAAVAVWFAVCVFTDVAVRLTLLFVGRCFVIASCRDLCVFVGGRRRFF